jgi:hypothetical protein
MAENHPLKYIFLGNPVQYNSFPSIEICLEIGGVTAAEQKL